MNRMNELPEEYQAVLNRLINHLASHSPMYRENAIKRLEAISRENPYRDDIPGLDKAMQDDPSEGGYWSIGRNGKPLFWRD